MNYNNVPDGYVLVTKKTEEIAKKFNLDKNKKNALYRDIKISRKEGRKYNDNSNSRIWLLNENIDEEYILKKIDPNFGEPTLMDILKKQKKKIMLKELLV